MAAKNASTHSRSFSLPSRAHPLTANVQEHFCRLRPSEETSTSSLSKKSNKLADLKDLYECVDDLFQMQTTKQNLSGCSEDVLGSSLRLLDLCSTAKDAFLQMRASVQDLESSLRRRESDVSSKVGNYLICMKRANKVVSKCFASSKKSKNIKHNETSAIISLLSEVEGASITIFESLFTSIYPAKTATKQKGWSLVAKLTQSLRVHPVGDGEENMYTALEALYKHNPNKETDILRIQEVQKSLMALDMNMQQCEEDFNSLLRSLVKTRVSLLNVFNN